MTVFKIFVFVFLIPPIYLFFWIVINVKIMIRMSSERPSTLDMFYRFQNIDIPKKSFNINKGSLQPETKEKHCSWYRIFLIYQTEDKERKTKNLTYTISYTSFEDANIYISDIRDTLTKIRSTFPIIDVIEVLDNNDDVVTNEV